MITLKAVYLTGFTAQALLGLQALPAPAGSQEIPAESHGAAFPASPDRCCRRRGKRARGEGVGEERNKPTAVRPTPRSYPGSSRDIDCICVLSVLAQNGCRCITQVGATH